MNFELAKQIMLHTTDIPLSIVKPSMPKKDSRCMHWTSNKACYYSMMLRCQKDSYGCTFDQES